MFVSITMRNGVGPTNMIRRLTRFVLAFSKLRNFHKHHSEHSNGKCPMDMSILVTSGDDTCWSVVAFGCNIRLYRRGLCVVCSNRC